MSLKTILKEEIEKRGQVSKFELEKICKDSGFQWADNGTSRLRELVRAESIEPIKNEKGVITGYKKKESDIVEYLNEGIGTKIQKEVNNSLF